MQKLVMTAILLLVINCFFTLWICREMRDLQNARFDGEFLEFMPKGVDRYGRIEKQYHKVLKMLSEGGKL